MYLTYTIIRWKRYFARLTLLSFVVGSDTCVREAMPHALLPVLLLLLGPLNMCLEISDEVKEVAAV